jgi:hypothetical protein
VQVRVVPQPHVPPHGAPRQLTVLVVGGLRLEHELLAGAVLERGEVGLGDLDRRARVARGDVTVVDGQRSVPSSTLTRAW